MPHELPPPSTFRSVHFPGQHDGERIMLVLRRHPFVFILTTIFFLFLALLPAGVRLLVPTGVFPLVAGTAGEGLLVLALATYYLFLWLFYAYAWLDYYLDLWIITEERIVNIEQVGLFNRVISEQSLLRVQDVTSEVKGIFPTFLDYGHVFVQTAGEKARFVFEQVPRPDLVKKVVLQVNEEAMKRSGITPSIAAHGL